MKKLFLLLAVLLIAVIASAENYILYTSTDGKVVNPFNSDYYDAFGANIVSNTYSNGQGKIVFDGDVKMIGYTAFLNINNLSTITIPKSVTTIGNEAFKYCENLTSVEIPNSVTTIGESAFAECI